jgi:hypothetical protein
MEVGMKIEIELEDNHKRFLDLLVLIHPEVHTLDDAAKLVFDSYIKTLCEPSIFSTKHKAMKDEDDGPISISSIIGLPVGKAASSIKAVRDIVKENLRDAAGKGAGFGGLKGSGLGGHRGGV